MHLAKFKINTPYVYRLLSLPKKCKNFKMRANIFFFYIKYNDKSEAHAYIITKIHLFYRDNWKTHSNNTKCTVVNKKRRP